MSIPLFTEEEEAAYRAQRDRIEEQWQQNVYHSFDAYWGELQACEEAEKKETIARVEARAEEFLNALIIFFGSRARKYIDFRSVFAEAEYVYALCVQYDTPEARRDAHTFLKAFSEAPRSWGRSAFMRFLRGIGKQRGASYYGAGMFSALQGWREREVEAFCRVLVSEECLYGHIFVSYAHAGEEACEEDFDFEYIESDVQFKATRADRNVRFLECLCRMLEERGLGDMPAKKAPREKKEHIPKIFKAGDMIRARTLRDLPLPAHVRVPILRRNRDATEWTPDILEMVVTRVPNRGGTCVCLIVDHDRKASREVFYGFGYDKSLFDGATFLGLWTGEYAPPNKTLALKFLYQKPPRTSRKS
ncbi:MAG: hypothetical protein KGI50_02985 [Patescibacteria group bacterium]|nr:hypothetical protein [Patescibacteria group bacterium]MDE2438257.1 hypothetical protein [Patescibacteria group bacterium]